MSPTLPRLLTLIRAHTGGVAADADGATQLKAALTEALAKGYEPSEVEVAALEQALATPHDADAFTSDVRRSMQALVDRGARRAPAAPVETILFKLERIRTADELPQRFLADLSIARGELFDVPGASASQREARMLRFFGGYAERFVALCEGLVPPDRPWLPPVPRPNELERAVLVERFSVMLAEQGLARPELVRAMLNARSPNEVRALVQAAGGDVTVQTHAARENDVTKLPPARPPVEPERERDSQRRAIGGESGPGKRSASRKSLWWGVLQRYRRAENPEEESAAQVAISDAALAGGLVALLGLVLLALALAHL